MIEASTQINNKINNVACITVHEKKRLLHLFIWASIWCLNDDSEKRKYQNAICKESISFVCQKERTCSSKMLQSHQAWCSFDIDNVNAIPLVLLRCCYGCYCRRNQIANAKTLRMVLFCSMLFENSKYFFLWSSLNYEIIRTWK